MKIIPNINIIVDLALKINALSSSDLSKSYYPFFKVKIKGKFIFSHFK